MQVALLLCSLVLLLIVELRNSSNESVDYRVSIERHGSENSVHKRAEANTGRAVGIAWHLYDLHRRQLHAAVVHCCLRPLRYGLRGD